MKTLVAYFSASGITKQVAETLAKELNADVYEIEPQNPYTDADLDWQDPTSRSTVEMKDRTSRPAIKGSIQDMAQYDRVCIGFPIWWYREPSIIDTFLESYDFSGKIILPFATSGGSGLGETKNNILAIAPTAKVLEGKCFTGPVTNKMISDWIAQWIS